MAPECLGLCPVERDTQLPVVKATTWTWPSRRLFAAAAQCRPKSKTTVRASRSPNRCRELRDRESRWWADSSVMAANDHHHQKKRTHLFQCRRITNLFARDPRAHNSKNTLLVFRSRPIPNSCRSFVCDIYTRANRRDGAGQRRHMPCL